MTTTVVETYPNGDKFEGQVGTDGMKSGWGKYSFANGKIYEGHWSNGKMNGWGEFVESDTKDRFVGEWEDANRKFGIYYYANGDMYQGGFEKSMKHGRGVIWENKMMYEAVYSRDKLVSKVPWKVKMVESPQRSASVSSHPHPHHPKNQSPPRHGHDMEAARERIEDLEVKNDAQETQILILAKEIKSLQMENAALKESKPRGAAAPVSRRGGTPTAPRSRSAGRPSGSTNRAATPKRGGGGGGGGPPDRTSSVVYKRKAAADSFEAMNANRLREEFRYYYNHFDD
eukprot:TRINITY_DN10364_c0_g4_i1.p2 TRINITY_DN10364_c0_g4~~TRINITY_DN10364_c0_g4_i1.p2  ORF type:complete len:286 (+),score=56.51 TRINITY_DN10364_c0_g4_i1:962-1819(+)